MISFKWALNLVEDSSLSYLINEYINSIFKFEMTFSIVSESLLFNKEKNISIIYVTILNEAKSFFNLLLNKPN